MELATVAKWHPSQCVTGECVSAIRHLVINVTNPFALLHNEQRIQSTITWLQPDKIMFN